MVEKDHKMRKAIVEISGGFYGAENLVYEVTEHLTKYYDIYLFTNEEMLPYYEELDDVTIINVGNFHHSVSNKFMNKLLRWTQALMANRIIKDEINKKGIQMIALHLSGLTFSLFFGLKEVPIVYTIHLSNPDNLIFTGRELVNKLFSLPRCLFSNIVNLIALKYSDAIICYSLGMKDYLKKRCDPEKIYLLDKGVNTKIIQLSPLLDNDEDFILLVTRLEHIKFPDIVIYAMKEVVKEFPEIKLKIIGAGSIEENLKELTKDLNLEKNIEFLGFIPPPKLYSYYKSAKICVLPIGKHSYSLTQLEAKAAGRPIVTSDTKEISRIIKNNKNGILVEPIPKKIANAIIYLLRNPEIMEEMSKTNLKEAKMNDWEIIVKQYVEVFGDVVRGEEP